MRETAFSFAKMHQDARRAVSAAAHTHFCGCSTMRLSRFILIVFALAALAFCSVLTSLGWARILFYTGWCSQNASYPVVVLFFAACYAWSIGRLGSASRAGAASLLAFLLTTIALVAFRVGDLYFSETATGAVKAFFGMTSIIAEEDFLNTTAVIGGAVLPLFFLFLLPLAVRILKPKV